MEYHTRYNISGFSLVELSVVLVILSMLLTIMLTIVPIQEDKEAHSITEQKIEAIENAIMAYFNQKGYLPCPAPLDAPLTNTGSATDCSVAGTVGTSYIDVGSGVDRVRIGAVPIKELNLSEQFGYDGWNNRFSLAVITQLAQSNRLFNLFSTTTARVITILDDTGNSVNPSNPSQVAYVIISHGRNGSGSRNYQGTLSFTCSGGLDVENCDADNTFRDQFKNFSNAAAYYDDIIRWKTKEQLEVIGDHAGTGRGTTAKYGLFVSRSAANLGRATGGSFSLHAVNTTVINNTNVTSSGSTLTYPAGNYYIRDSKMGCGLDSFYYLPWIGSVLTPGSLEHATSAGNKGCAWSTASSHFTFGSTTASTAYIYGLAAEATFGSGRAVGGQNTYYLVREVWEY